MKMIKRIILGFLTITLTLSPIHASAEEYDLDEEYLNSALAIYSLYCNYVTLAGGEACPVIIALDSSEILMEAVAAYEDVYLGSSKITATLSILATSAEAFWRFGDTLGKAGIFRKKILHQCLELYEDRYTSITEEVSTVFKMGLEGKIITDDNLNNIQERMNPSKISNSLRDLSHNWIFIFSTYPKQIRELANQLELLYKTIDVKALYQEAYNMYSNQSKNESNSSSQQVQIPSESTDATIPSHTPTPVPSSNPTPTPEPTIASTPEPSKVPTPAPTEPTIPTEEYKTVYVYYCYTDGVEFSPLEYYEGSHYYEYTEYTYSKPLEKIQYYSSVNGAPVYFNGVEKALYYLGEKNVPVNLYQEGVTKYTCLSDACPATKPVYAYYCYTDGVEFSPLEYYEGVHYSQYHEFLYEKPLKTVQYYSSVNGAPVYFNGSGLALYYWGDRNIGE